MRNDNGSSRRAFLTTLGAATGLGLLATTRSASAGPVALLKGVPAIVFDAGDGIANCGFARDESPSISFWPKTILAGEVMKHAIGLMKVDPSQYRLLAVVRPGASAEDIESLNTAAKELRMAAFTTVDAATAAVRATGKSSGLAVLVGAHETTVVPVVNRKPLVGAVQTTPVADDDIERFLGELIGQSTGQTQQRETVRDIKEKLAYVALDYEEELQKSESSSGSQSYGTLDGQVIAVGTERFRGPEVLFAPNLIGSKAPSIDRAAVAAVAKAPADAQAGLRANVVVGGRGAQLANLGPRLAKQMQGLAKGTSVTAAAMSASDVSWRGGAQIAGLSTFEEMWITGVLSTSAEASFTLDRSCSMVTK